MTKPDIAQIIKQNRTNLIILFGMTAYYFFHCYVLGNSFAAAAFHDDGWLSSLNIMMIGAAGALAFHFIPRQPTLHLKVTFFCIFYCLLIYGLREADFHRFFTADYYNVDNIKLYTKAKVPIHIKLIAGSIFFPFFLCLAYLVLTQGWLTLKAFFAGRPWAVAFAFWGTLLVISQFMDKSGFNSADDWRIKGIEEMLEVTASIFACAAMCYYTIETLSNALVDKVCQSAKD